VLERAGQPLSSVLARAVYAGRPGHPVLVGREHWIELSEFLRGDSGAGEYLTAHHALEVECGDLWSGADVDAR
jgi:CTP:molybdopterin cytidylyltransferase MocA